MRLLFVLLLCCIFTPLIYAKSKSAESTDYQVDVVLFQHPGITKDSNESPLTLALPSNTKRTIPLRSQVECDAEIFCLQELKTSHLKQSWYALKRNPDYRVLGRYTWRQPNNNTQAVRLPEQFFEDIKIEGTLQVRKGNYYYFNSALYLYSANSATPLILKQHVRLKDEQTVYLDNPNVGMLVRIHKVTG